MKDKIPLMTVENQSTLWVGIAGPIGAGKSTLARKLCEKIIAKGRSCYILPFARWLKEIAAQEHDSDRLNVMKQMYMSWNVEEEVAADAALHVDQAMRAYQTQPGVKNRRLLQLIGHEFGRELIHDHVWVHASHYWILDHPADIVISDDVRYANEAQTVDKLIRIINAPLVQDTHASEHSLKNISHDYAILYMFSDNDVDELVEQLLTD